ncbi:MAG: CoA transferase [Actinobacteria bacterium]|nr:CoA transferase [Actinomycetota bacterium]
MSTNRAGPLPVLRRALVEAVGQVDGAAATWAASGAMALTGAADGPPRQVPGSVATGLEAAAEALHRLGGLAVDGPALLGERAAIAGLGRGGATSVGGSARLLEAADGPVCLNLARPDDVAALPALLEQAIDIDDHRAVRRAVAGCTGAWLAERADLLGVPLGVPGTAPDGPFTALAAGAGFERPDVPLVVELGSLWAAPLCGDLLRRSGCRVVKVEATGRPDAARRGPGEFFDLLNGGKASVVLDLRRRPGRESLARLVAAADVVIEGSRPRALAQLGVDAHREVERGAVWLSITGYGRTGPRAGGVAFGDDAAVSGGLFLEDPLAFVADAVADPSTGLVAAVAVLAALDSGSGVVLDVPLAGVARWMARSDPVPTGQHHAEPPRARLIAPRAADLGADTARMLP